jgi:ribosomal protein L37E
MNQELVKKFQDRFEWVPKLNPLYNKKMIVPMYIDCDEGWFDLIWKLCEDIDEIVKREGWTDFSVDQIKEKFGGLRFYINGANKEIFDLINEAEAKSFNICERCGKKGVAYVSYGWVKTLCSKCAKADTKRTWNKVTEKMTDGINK